MNVEIKLTNNEMLNNFNFEISDESELKFFIAIWIRKHAKNKQFNPKNYLEFNKDINILSNKWIKKLETEN